MINAVFIGTSLDGYIADKDGGLEQLYIDGGELIQSFLQENMIDEMIITQIPFLLGGGTPLFGNLPAHLTFKLVGTEALLNAMVQSHYKRIR